MTQEKILNKGMALAERYQQGEMSKVVREAAKDAKITAATMISLPQALQPRFAEKVINGK